MSEGMIPHAVRVDAAAWKTAVERAKIEDRTISDVVRTALRAYADGRYDAVKPIRKKEVE